MSSQPPPRRKADDRLSPVKSRALALKFMLELGLAY
jgi:hypothetical protein